MSRSELTDAYVSGRISRRSFVRGMVALGASVPVALALADQASAASGASAKLSRTADVYTDGYPKPPPKKEPEPVTQLPATGSGGDEGTSIAAPIAAGAAAAALVALRMRQPKKDESEA
jgi:hypothetical protein